MTEYNDYKDICHHAVNELKLKQTLIDLMKNIQKTPREKSYLHKSDVFKITLG